METIHQMKKKILFFVFTKNEISINIVYIEYQPEPHPVRSTSINVCARDNTDAFFSTRRRVLKLFSLAHELYRSNSLDNKSDKKEFIFDVQLCLNI